MKKERKKKKEVTVKTQRDIAEQVLTAWTKVPLTTGLTLQSTVRDNLNAQDSSGERLAEEKGIEV